MVKLTKGSVERMHVAREGEDLHLFDRHVVQILSIKPILYQIRYPFLERYRVILSDGDNFIQAILGITLNNMAADRTLRKFCVVALESSSVRMGLYRNRCVLVSPACDVLKFSFCRFLIIMALSVLETLDTKIGNPTVIDGSQHYATSPSPGPRL